MKKLIYCFFVSVCLYFSSVLYAQDNLNQTLSKLSSDAASAYVAPVVSGFGANLNSGWVHRIVPAKMFSIDIEITFVGMGTFFGSNNQSFATNGQFRFSRDQAMTLTSNIGNPDARNAIVDQIINQDFQVGIQGPTIVGIKSQDLSINFPGKTFTYNSQSYTVPSQNVDVAGATGLLDNLSILPLAAPQLSIGTFYGTAMELRFLPSIQINKDLGSFSYFGIGFQHNPAVWLDTPLPLDVSVGFYTQTMKVGTIFKSTATSVGIYAGKTFGYSLLGVSPYAGFTFESSTITVNYNHTVDTQAGPENINVSFDLKGENSVRFTVGASFKLAIINLNVDYSLAKYNTLSAGLGFSF